MHRISTEVGIVYFEDKLQPRSNSTQLDSIIE
jgi:hypothetical protein